MAIYKNRQFLPLKGPCYAIVQGDVVQGVFKTRAAARKLQSRANFDEELAFRAVMYTARFTETDDIETINWEG